MKRTILVFVILCLLLTLCPAAFAAGADVIDNADVLTERELSQLARKAESISDTYGISVVLLTEPVLSGNTYTMADDHFYNGGYGDDGILFLLVTESRDWEIATYGDVTGLISDSESEALFRAAQDDLADNDYFAGFVAYLNALDAKLLENSANGDGSTPNEEPSVSIFISVIAGAVVALIALLIMRGKMNTVHPQRAATNYMKSGSYSLTRQRDLFLYSNTTRTRRSQNNGSSGVSGGGSSRGGSRGKF